MNSRDWIPTISPTIETWECEQDKWRVASKAALSFATFGRKMKTKLFFLLVLPLVWLAVALISYQLPADKLYVLAIAPSAWLAVFGNWLSYPRTIPQLVVAGFPAMLAVGFILLKLKMTPRVAIISSLILAIILWGLLLALVWQSRAIRVPGAPLALFLCCFNLSLCFLPIVALLGIIGRGLVRAFRRKRTAT